ncbi:MAG: protein kinase [Ignavibacteriaceae bacterium]|nr:protein kinase [Ignavibacteriaceae bacterium]
MIGSRIDHYKIVDILGEGGMGIVYKAFDLKLERYSAIKILNAAALNNPQFIERFKREAKNQAKLTHPNIVPVYGFTEGMKLLGIVMEYVEGETLEHLILRQGRLSTSQTIDLMQQILSGAAYAHKKGFVHRDLKPSNVIISKDGIAKIMDFGISKSLKETKGITRTGVKIGTVLYMSPEQIKAQEPTIQSDIYSLGIILFEMLTGKNPFDFPTEFEILEAHLKKNPPKLSSEQFGVPSEMDSIIANATNKSTSKRYQTGENFSADLNLLSAKLTVEENKRLNKKTRTRQIDTPTKNKMKFGVFMTIFAIIFVLLFYFVYQAVDDYWHKGKVSKTDADFGSNTYRTNPSFATRSAWKAIYTGTDANLNSISFADDFNSVAVGNGIILHSDNGGQSWLPAADSGVGSINKVVAVSADKFIAVGDSGSIWLSSSKGVIWEKSQSPVNVALFGLYFLQNGRTGFSTGINGTILKTVDGGLSWRTISSPTHELLYSVSFFDDQRGIIVGWNGTILKTENQGETWSKLKSFSDKYIKDIAVIEKNTAVVCCGGGEIFRTENGGDDWDKINTSTISGLYSVLFLNDKTGFAIGSKGVVLISTDGGQSWNQTSSGTFGTLNAVAKKSGGFVYAAGDNGVMIYSGTSLN